MTLLEAHLQVYRRDGWGDSAVSVGGYRTLEREGSRTHLYLNEAGEVWIGETFNTAQALSVNPRRRLDEEASAVRHAYASAGVDSWEAVRELDCKVRGFGLGVEIVVPSSPARVRVYRVDTGETVMQDGYFEVSLYVGGFVAGHALAAAEADDVFATFGMVGGKG